MWRGGSKNQGERNKAFSGTQRQVLNQARPPEPGAEGPRAGLEFWKSMRWILRMDLEECETRGRGQERALLG